MGPRKNEVRQGSNTRRPSMTVARDEHHCPRYRALSFLHLGAAPRHPGPRNLRVSHGCRSSYPQTEIRDERTHTWRGLVARVKDLDDKHMGRHLSRIMFGFSCVRFDPSSEISCLPFVDIVIPSPRVNILQWKNSSVTIGIDIEWAISLNSARFQRYRRVLPPLCGSKRIAYL